MKSMDNGYTVYKIYNDGSGEIIAWFQYLSSCAIFVARLTLSDFTSGACKEDEVLILTIHDSTKQIASELTRRLGVDT